MAKYGHKPFGLRKIRLVNISDTAYVDLPAAQTLQLRVRTLGGELKGDDGLASAAASIEAAEWSLQAGGIDLDALAILTGQAVSESGTAPNEVTTLNLAAGDVMPYFKIYGRSLGDGSDDVHVKLYKCKLTGKIEGSLQNGQFFFKSLQGVAIDDGTNGVIDIVQNETGAELPGIGQWYEQQPGVAAYEFERASSYANALINRLNPGVYDAFDAGAAFPSFTAGVGMSYSAPDSQHLMTGITPLVFNQDWSLFVVYANSDVVSQRPLLSAGNVGTSQLFELWSSDWPGAGRFYGAGSQSAAVLPTAASGCIGISGRNCYRDGALEATLAQGAAAATGQDIRIGQYVPKGWYYHGDMKRIFIADYAMSYAQALRMMTAMML